MQPASPIDAFISQLLSQRFSNSAPLSLGTSNPSAGDFFSNLIGGFQNKGWGNRVQAAQQAAQTGQQPVAPGVVASPVNTAQYSAAPTDSPYKEQFASAANAYGVPVGVLQAIASIESSFNPNAANGTAKGMMQLTDPISQKYGVSNAFDPSQNIAGGAQYLRDLHQQFPDWNDAAMHYFVGPNGSPDARDSSGASGSDYRTKFANAYSKYSAPVDYSSPQFGPQSTVPVEKAAYVCGPIAAQALARAYGKDIPIDQVIQAAEKNGLTPAGMGGPQNEVNTEWSMGLNNVYNHPFNNSWDSVESAINNGHPAIISTPDHYYFSNQYDPSRGFFVGNTGANGKLNGSSWMTPQMIAALSGNPNGFIYEGE